MTRRFWVYIEQEDGKAHPVAWELLGVARRLADEVNDNAVVEGILVGHQMEELAKEAIQYGAQTVYVVDDPALKNYLNKPYTTVLTDLVKKYDPEVFLVGATTLGRDLAGAVATSIGTGLTADTTHLAMGEVNGSDKKLLQATRPAFGGNVIATILCRDYRPQMATVRPRVFTSAPRQADAKGFQRGEECAKKGVGHVAQFQQADVGEYVERPFDERQEAGHDEAGHHAPEAVHAGPFQQRRPDQLVVEHTQD